MQHVYIATIRAGHDFNNQVWQKVFHHRADAYAATHAEKERQREAAIKGDPCFEYGFHFSSTIEAVEIL